MVGRRELAHDLSCAAGTHLISAVKADSQLPALRVNAEPRSCRFQRAKFGGNRSRSCRRSHKRMLVVTLPSLCMPTLCQAFVPSLPSTATTTTFHDSLVGGFAKRNKNRRDDDDSMTRWYDDVDDNATPNGVFWEEMERQRLFNQLGGENRNREMMPPASSSSYSDYGGSNGGGGASSMSTSTMGSMADPSVPRKAPTMEELKSAESTLSEYTLFQVSDNWLDEDLKAYSLQVGYTEEEELSLDEETRRLEEQLEALPDGFGRNRGSFLVDSDGEPWDSWGDSDSRSLDPDRANTITVPEPAPGK